MIIKRNKRPIAKCKEKARVKGNNVVLYHPPTDYTVILDGAEVPDWHFVNLNANQYGKCQVGRLIVTKHGDPAVETYLGDVTVIKGLREIPADKAACAEVVVFRIMDYKE